MMAELANIAFDRESLMARLPYNHDEQTNSALDDCRNAEYCADMATKIRGLFKSIRMPAATLYLQMSEELFDRADARRAVMSPRSIHRLKQQLEQKEVEDVLADMRTKLPPIRPGHLAPAVEIERLHEVVKSCIPEAPKTTSRDMFHFSFVYGERPVVRLPPSSQSTMRRPLDPPSKPQQQMRPDPKLAVALPLQPSSRPAATVVAPAPVLPQSHGSTTQQKEQKDEEKVAEHDRWVADMRAGKLSFAQIAGGAKPPAPPPTPIPSAKARTKPQATQTRSSQPLSSPHPSSILPEIDIDD